MLPSAPVFASAMGKLGIRRADTVVVYDSPSLGIFSAPRAAWTLRVFGHEKVHLLNNFKVWVEEGLPIETGTAEVHEQAEYEEVAPNLQMVADFEEVKALAEMRLGGGKSDVQLLDARPGGRFRGAEPEPRPGACSLRLAALSLPLCYSPWSLVVLTGRCSQASRLAMFRGRYRSRSATWSIQ